MAIPSNGHRGAPGVAADLARSRAGEIDEFERGWAASRAAGHKPPPAALDALGNSGAALGGCFAAMHCEGGGAERRDAHASAHELQDLAGRAGNVLDTHGGVFERLVAAALDFSAPSWEPEAALSAIAEEAGSQGLELARFAAMGAQRARRADSGAFKAAAAQMGAAFGALAAEAAEPARGGALTGAPLSALRALIARMAIEGSAAAAPSRGPRSGGL